MKNQNRTYIAIDLKSYYASVECVSRNLDPMTTNLVVADQTRTEKTICLAVSPALKRLGVPGRPRLFEVVQKVKEINAERKYKAPDHKQCGTSFNSLELQNNPALAVDYIIAPPRMSYYITQSTAIYEIYMKYVAPEDIHVYSIDEVFMDVTNYLKSSGLSAHEFAKKIIKDVLQQTGITATAGIGSNLYLAKIAMDIVAKHVEPDKDGVCIAKLDEISYRKLLWNHQPITDFWRVGKGYEKKLAEHGIYTMGDVARCSIGSSTNPHNEDLLYRLFGINAELLIDHAWGWEPCSMKEIKAYRPQASSAGTSQVLSCPYTAEKAKLIIKEMADQLSMDLFEKKLAADQLVLTVGYDIENLNSTEKRTAYKGTVKTDRYGRAVPNHAHGTISLNCFSSSTKKFVSGATQLFDRIVDTSLLIRRIALVANHVIYESDIPKNAVYEQIDLFTDYTEKKMEEEKKRAEHEKERKLQQALIDIKHKFGKNAILKGISLQDGATAKERNAQIGGHKA